MAEMITHTTLEKLVEAGAVRTVAVVGLPGGWGVRVRYGMVERTLAARRGSVRVWRRLDTAAAYLRGLGLPRFEVDAANYEDLPAQIRPDRAQALRRAHEAATHDRWFRDQVTAAVAAADHPDAVWHEWDSVKQDLEARRAALAARRGR